MQHNYEVKRVARQDCEEYILRIHYARRWTTVQYAFGLFRDGLLCGVIVYSPPYSPAIRRAIAGLEYEINVLELSRLCLRDNIKTEASTLVSRSIKLLPPNKIIVSYADTKQNHRGCVYQAANFIYTGLSTKCKVMKLRGENRHQRHLLDQFKDSKNKFAAAKEQYGDRLYKEDNSQKHRYIYIHGSHKFKKDVIHKLHFKPRPYPKPTDTIESLEDSFKQQDALELYDDGKELSSNDFSDLCIV